MKRYILMGILFFIANILNAQKDHSGFSLHSNILSITKPMGFDTPSKLRPGNFNFGGQYNYYFSDFFGVNLGTEFSWFELNGSMYDQLTGFKLKQTQFEIFAPVFFLGLDFAFYKTSFFIKGGFSYAAKYNQLGNFNGWVLSGDNISIIPFNIGFKQYFTDRLSLLLSGSYNFGNKLKFDEVAYQGNYNISKEINYFMINLGVSFDLFDRFGSDAKIKSMIDSLEMITIEAREQLSIMAKEKTDMEEENLYLRTKLENITITEEDIVLEEVNKKNYLKFGEEYELSLFLRDGQITRGGSIIFEEYNNFSAKYKFNNDEIGLYIKCIVPEVYLNRFKDISNKYKFIEFDIHDVWDKVKFEINLERNRSFNRVNINIK